MFLTLDTINKYYIDKLVLEKFLELYPNGEEVTKIIQDSRAPSILLHWIFEFLFLNEEEIEAYKKRLNIVNSIDFLRSKNIINSNSIYNARDCKDSSFIHNSSIVEGSKNIMNSRKIYFSSNIFDSKDIIKSSNVVQSTLIQNSSNIFASKKIYRSKSAFRCDNIFDSVGLRNCKNIKNSFFCASCDKSANLLFCYNLTGANYCIFNQPVIEEDFFNIKNELEKQFTDLNFNFFNFVDDFLTTKKYSVNEIYSEHYKKIPETFFNYIKSIPNYDSFILYNITLNKAFIN